MSRTTHGVALIAAWWLTMLGLSTPDQPGTPAADASLVFFSVVVVGTVIVLAATTDAPRATVLHRLACVLRRLGPRDEPVAVRTRRRRVEALVSRAPAFTVGNLIVGRPRAPGPSPTAA